MTRKQIPISPRSEVSPVWAVAEIFAYISPVFNSIPKP